MTLTLKSDGKLYLIQGELPEKPKGMHVLCDCETCSNMRAEYDRAIQSLIDNAVEIGNQKEAHLIVRNLHSDGNLLWGPKVGELYHLPDEKYEPIIKDFLSGQVFITPKSPQQSEETINLTRAQRDELWKVFQPWRDDEVDDIIHRLKEAGYTISKSNTEGEKKTEEAASQLIEAYKEYIRVLNDEINSLVGLAFVHGWRSENYERGKECREKIERLTAQFQGTKEK